MKQPNVIIIMADQLRHDFVKPDFTPNICSLLEESVTFSNAYCASPLCVPARGSFYTGLYPNETGSIINPWIEQDAEHGDVRAGIANLYEMMETGWDSYHAGKQHLYTAPLKLEDRPGSPTHFVATDRTYAHEMTESGVPKPGGDAFRGVVPELVSGTTTRAARYSYPNVEPYEHGFDNFSDAHFTRGAVAAVQGHQRDRPLLLNLTYFAPHPPYHVPEPWYSLHPEVEVASNVSRWYRGQSPLQLYNYPGIAGPRHGLAHWQEVWSVYAGLVGLLDHCVELVLAALKERGMYDDSLIIFTSDHGEMLGSHQLWQKMCMYEESIRTPLSFKLPTGAEFADVRAASGGTTVSDRVSAVDVLPTICELCDLDPPSNMSGQSLVDLMRSSNGNDTAATAAFTDRPIFVQFDGNGARGNFQRCMIKGRHKLIVDMFKDETFLELYDIEGDPQETTNLALDSINAGVVNGMISEIGEYMREPAICYLRQR